MSEPETKAEPKYQDYPYDKNLGIKTIRGSTWLDYVNARHSGYNNSEWDKNLHVPIFKTEEEYDAWAEKERERLKKGRDLPASFLRRWQSRFTGNIPEHRSLGGRRSRKNKRSTRKNRRKSNRRRYGYRK